MKLSIKFFFSNSRINFFIFGKNITKPPCKKKKKTIRFLQGSQKKKHKWILNFFGHAYVVCMAKSSYGQLPFKNVVCTKNAIVNQLWHHPIGHIPSFAFAQQQKIFILEGSPNPPLPPPFILGDQFEGETGFREKTRDQRQDEFTDNSLMHPLFGNNSRSKLPWLVEIGLQKRVYKERGVGHLMPSSEFLVWVSVLCMGDFKDNSNGSAFVWTNKLTTLVVH